MEAWEEMVPGSTARAPVWARRPRAQGHWEPSARAPVQALKDMASGPTARATICARKPKAQGHWEHPSRALMEALKETASGTTGGWGHLAQEAQCAGPLGALLEGADGGVEGDGVGATPEGPQPG